MVKNKNIILLFLFLAWAIIFAHSVIPHHHHNPNDLISHCEQNHNFKDHRILQEEIHDCHHDCFSHACHFHVDVLTKINIDNDFIVSFEYQPIYQVETSKGEKSIFNYNFIKQPFTEINYLRGPPHHIV